MEALTPQERLVAVLHDHALVIGEVTLTSGAIAQYYVDAKRAILRPRDSPPSPSWWPSARPPAAPPRSAG
jgi:hypothetical protein